MGAPIVYKSDGDVVQRARNMRAAGHTLQAISNELSVPIASVHRIVEKTRAVDRPTDVVTIQIRPEG